MTSNENQGLVTHRKPSTTIRPAHANDADFILSLAPRFVAFDLPRGRRKRETLATLRTDFGRALRNTPPNDHFFIAENGGGTRVGFLHLQLQRDFFSGRRACHVSNLGVTNRHEGQGIGRVLLDYAKGWAKRHRCNWVTLSVFPGNARARALYEHAGFTDDLVRMAMPVRPASPRR